MTGRKDPENSGEYTEHLEVLRRKILSVLLFFFFSAVLLFLFSEHTAAFLLAPLEGLGVSLYYFRPYEKLLTYMRLAFWGGLMALVCISAALEWSRLYRFEPLLPGHAGGVVGQTIKVTANSSRVLLLTDHASGIAGIVQRGEH